VLSMNRDGTASTINLVCGVVFLMWKHCELVHDDVLSVSPLDPARCAPLAGPAVLVVDHLTVAAVRDGERAPTLASRSVKIPIPQRVTTSRSKDRTPGPRATSDARRSASQNSPP